MTRTGLIIVLHDHLRLLYLVIFKQNALKRQVLLGFYSSQNPQTSKVSRSD
jgi:hypothetical protein